MTNAAVIVVALAIAVLYGAYVYSMFYQRDISHKGQLNDSLVEFSVDEAVQAEYLTTFSRLTFVFQGHGLIVKTSSGFVAGKIFPYWNKVRQFLG